MVSHVYFSDTTQAICNVIEAIFIHGLKDAFFLKSSRYSKYPEPVGHSLKAFVDYLFLELLAVRLEVHTQEHPHADCLTKANKERGGQGAGVDPHRAQRIAVRALHRDALPRRESVEVS